MQPINYRFQQVVDDTYQDFLFQILPILFEHAHSLYQ